MSARDLEEGGAAASGAGTRGCALGTLPQAAVPAPETAVRSPTAPQPGIEFAAAGDA